MKPSVKCARVLAGTFEKLRINTLLWARFIAAHSRCDDLLEALRELRDTSELGSSVARRRRVEAIAKADAELDRWKD